jgi:hypothetical protein
MASSPDVADRPCIVYSMHHHVNSNLSAGLSKSRVVPYHREKLPRSIGALICFEPESLIDLLGRVFLNISSNKHCQRCSGKHDPPSRASQSPHAERAPHLDLKVVGGTSNGI